jgi:hypothetical protein
MSEITVPAPNGDPNPANRQQSSYAGVSTADLFVLLRAVSRVPGNQISGLATSAVIGRISRELDRRPSAERRQTRAAMDEMFNAPRA